MTFKSFGMVATDTTRTRAYLAAMERAGILPSFVLFLPNETSTRKPGQAGDQDSNCIIDNDWPEAQFSLTDPILPWIERLNIQVEIAPSGDINDNRVVDAVAKCEPSILVYSGYGGVLLKGQVLNAGKRFLHVHGGYLPDFKGSTTNYFSMLSHGLIGASAIYLTPEIDCGPILIRRWFPAPPQRGDLDHVYDSAARARVLVEVLTKLSDQQNLDAKASSNMIGDTFYIIHPVLKHLAILSDC